MLKERSEMLKTRKKGKTIKLGNFFPGNPEDFRDTGKFFETIPFSKKMEIRGKEKS